MNVLIVYLGILFILLGLVITLTLSWKRYYVLPLGLESEKFFHENTIRRTVCGEEVVLYDTCNHPRLVIRIYNPELLNRVILGSPNERHYIVWVRRGINKHIVPAG
jgi:hypothetical protein